MNKVAIILPCMNSGVHLKPALDSIINNTKFPFRLILVESESKDGTDKLCDEYAKYQSNVKVIHTKREGITKAINIGIKETSNDEDIYLTQDDVILPALYKRDWLTILNDISKNEEVGLITTINGGGISTYEYLNGFNWFGTWSLYIPRRTINKISYYEEI
jgi:glycosyltransferase involved in cell wall biosynthesis